MLYDYLKYGFGAFALVLAFSAYAFKSKRGVLVWAALSSLFAAVAAHYQVFWVVASMALMVPWALVCAGDWIDSAWRGKVGLCVALALASVLALYPTYIDERFNRPYYNPNISTEEQTALDQRAAAGELGFGRFICANIPFRMVRGLDLKGGFRVEYTVDVQEAIKDKRDRYYDDLQTTLARTFELTKADALPTADQVASLRQRVSFEKPREDVGKIVLKFVADEDAAKLDAAFLKRFDQELSLVRSTDRKVATFHIKKDVEEQIRDSAVAQAKDKILRRVDSLGLKEATISSRGDDIVVEVPGDDRRQFDAIKDIISRTARLEFKLLAEEDDFFGPISQDCPSCAAEGISWNVENAPQGEGKATLPRVFAELSPRAGESMADAHARFDAWGKTLPVPDTHQIAFEKQAPELGDDGKYKDTGWRSVYVLSRAEITGDMIRDASKAPDQSNGAGMGGWVVHMDFSPQGSDRFEKITGANVGKRFAIILDEKVESAPKIITKISGGSAQITMGQGGTAEQLKSATDLELVLKSGALPAPIDYKGEQQIGPSLGSDAIVQGLKGAVLSSMLVFFVMVLIYSRAGFIANIAVIFNMVLQVAILAMLGASMTLPGLAGLSLTIGIAVDANVLINERIRDELRAGKSPRQAVDIGYDRAFSAIVDGHVTTLISGLILFQYGSGPIKGFAVTLIVGMIVSLFTGVVCTRLVFDWVVRWRKVKQLSLG